MYDVDKVDVNTLKSYNKKWSEKIKTMKKFVEFIFGTDEAKDRLAEITDFELGTVNPEHSPPPPGQSQNLPTDVMRHIGSFVGGSRRRTRKTRKSTRRMTRKYRRK